MEQINESQAIHIVCPRSGGRIRIVEFLTEYAVIDRLIRHLELMFVAEKLPRFRP